MPKKVREFIFDISPSEPILKSSDIRLHAGTGHFWPGNKERLYTEAGEVSSAMPFFTT